MAKKKKVAKKRKTKRKPSAATAKKRELDKRYKVPRKWSAILRLIPGYDPFRDAEDCYFDAEAADLAVGFFEDCLHHVKGEKAGQPFILERWQKAAIGNLFGWKRPDGTRRYRTALFYIPRKNGKTTLAAGVVNYCLFAEDEPGAEIYSAAAERDQAAMVFNQAKSMVQMEDELSSRGTVYQRSIVLNDDSGFYKPISADASTKHGYNVSVAVVDELHAQKNRDLVDALETGTAARRQPLMLHITTADFDRPSICNEIHDYACKVRDGVINDQTFLPVLYEPKETELDKWDDPKVWKKVNPNLEKSFRMSYMVNKCKKAKEVPSFENTFKRLHLNMKTEQAVRWLPLDKWDQGAIMDETDFSLVKWYAGLDLASTTDIAAFVLYSPDNDCVVPFFWIPEDTAYDRERRDRVPYLTWAREGLINLTPGNVIDFDFIRRDINEAGKIYNIQEIAVDRWGSQQISTQLAGDGFEIVTFGQGFASMAAPTKELEKLVIGGDLKHGANAVLRWMASNVAVETDAAGNLKPSKKKSFEKIDGIVALIMAVGRAIAEDGETEESVYQERGIRLL